MKNNYTELEERLGYKFKDRQHLDTAFTHRSYVNEAHHSVESYERYEFLGDAILEYIVSKNIFASYPEKSEGELTKLRASLVCEYTLSQISRQLDFGKYLYLSHGENLTGGRDRSSILCDLFESVLGAIFLDSGIDEAEKYVERFLLTDIESKSLFYDAKSILQEYTQSKGSVLTYILKSEDGPEHNKSFTYQVKIDDDLYEIGVGNSKKTAEQIAAHKTLILLNKRGMICI